MQNDGDAYIAKYLANGSLDRNWGTRGVTKVASDPSRLAYDPESGRVYAVDVSPLSSSNLVIQRLDSRGRLDPTFGTNGRFDYQAESTADFPARQLTLQGVIARPSGRVLVALKRDSSRGRPSSGVSSNFETREDVALLQFNATGRDSNYANHGVSVLLGGGLTGGIFDTEKSQSGTFVNVTDLRATAGGGVSAVIARQQGSLTLSTVSNAIGRVLFSTGELSIKSRTLSAAGVIDPQSAYSWTLQPAAQRDTFMPLSATGDGRNVAVIGERFINYESVGQFTFLLAPGVRPQASAFLVNGVAATSVSRDSDGYFYAATGSSVVTKLNSRFAPVRSFGGRGSARVGDFINAFIPDDDGRVLALADDSVSRLT